MKRLILIALILAVAVMSGCSSLVEVRGNIKTVYGDTEKKVKIDKVVPYKLTFYKAKLFGYAIMTDEVLLEPSEIQKKFVEHFIQTLKKEFKEKDIVLVESNQEVIEVRITYYPGKKNMVAEFAGTRLIIKNADREIKRMVVGSFFGNSDEQKINDLAERLARESFQDFLKLL